MSHNDDKERSILARIRQRKKNEKSERSENQRKRMVFFFFFLKVDWIRKMWNLNHRHEI